MPDIKQKYAASVDTVTWTPGALANNGARQSTVVDNTTNGYIDAVLVLSLTSGASGVASTGFAEVYAYASLDGSTFTQGASGSDASYSIPTNGMGANLIGTMNVNAINTVFTAEFSVAAAFGGIMPPYWGIIVINRSGGALAASTHSARFRGVLGTT